jgi:hypothetical protein
MACQLPVVTDGTEERTKGLQRLKGLARAGLSSFA